MKQFLVHASHAQSCVCVVVSAGGLLLVMPICIKFRVSTALLTQAARSAAALALQLSYHLDSK
jgi:hypothetical protein